MAAIVSIVLVINSLITILIMKTIMTREHGVHLLTGSSLSGIDFPGSHLLHASRTEQRRDARHTKQQQDIYSQ